MLSTNDKKENQIWLRNKERLLIGLVQLSCYKFLGDSAHIALAPFLLLSVDFFLFFYLNKFYLELELYWFVLFNFFNSLLFLHSAIFISEGITGLSLKSIKENWSSDYQKTNDAGIPDPDGSVTWNFK